MARFVWSVVGAVLVGGVLAFGASWATGFVDDHLTETTFSATLACGSFLLAQRIRASGALAVVFAGLVYGSYGRAVGLSEETRRFLDGFWGYVGFLSNAVLFILIGLEIRLNVLWREIGWVSVGVLVVLLARALVVYPLTLSMHRISLAYGHVLFWSGLRGGVAVADR